METHWGKLAGYFVGLAIVITLVILIPEVGASSWMPAQVSTEGKYIDMLFWVLTVMSIIILAGVMAIVVYSATHFRAKPGDHSDGDPIHGHHTLEWIWTSAFAIIVLGISLVSWYVLIDQERPAPKGKGLTVQVRGAQFVWDFTYPDDGVKASVDLVVPIGRVTTFNVLSCSGREEEGFCAKRYGKPTTPYIKGSRDDNQGDVLHAFWVPEARMKVDAVPNINTKTQWTGDKISGPDDVFQVVCAELCGSGHNGMRTGMCIVSKEVFSWWIDGENSATTCTTLRMFSCKEVNQGDLDVWKDKVTKVLDADPEANCDDLEEAA